ncbi:PREDICTED: RNA-binding protein Musashi homolog 2-like [Ipomoea nil]|uniref:RNA-binding protein Musashi homolog 2-like n=1 Tax=Ipomoea nil TaxID=35883 RepID=UPI000901DA6A|nr:PREDICTED: RNA-binding protein Musashi homolog 2-like [Ipomoea nil]
MEQQIKLFVGGLSHGTNEQTLRDYFSKYGEIRSSETIRDRITGLDRGFGFIAFTDNSVVEHVLSDTHVILGKKVEVKVAKPKGSREGETRVKKIFVGGVPPDSTDEELKEHFEKFGTVEHAEIRRPRGFGFVTFESEEAAKTALRIRFQHMKNKMVEVKVAEVKPKVGLSNGMTNSLPLTCGGNMTFPIFPTTTNYPYGNPYSVNYVPYYIPVPTSEFCYNSYFPGYYNGGNWQHLNNPNPLLVTGPPLANSQPVVIGPPLANSQPVAIGPPPSRPIVIRPPPSRPVVIRPPPLKVEEQNGNMAEEIDEIQDEIDGESVTNGEVQTQDEIDGELLAKVAVSAGDSF